MSDLSDYLLLAEAAELLPGHPSVRTLRRWASAGQGGVRLHTTMVGGRRCTTEAALLEFMEKCTEARSGGETPCRTSREQEAAVKAARRTFSQVMDRLRASSRAAKG